MGWFQFGGGIYETEGVIEDSEKVESRYLQYIRRLYCAVLPKYSGVQLISVCSMMFCVAVAVITAGREGMVGTRC